MTSLYVCNLPPSATEIMLALRFTEFGTVLSVKLKRNMQTGVSHGQGFVEMKTNAEALSAVQGLNATCFEGRVLSVSRAARS